MKKLNNQKCNIFENEKEFSKYLRSIITIDSFDGDKISDEFLVDESHGLGEWEYNKHGYIVHRFDGLLEKDLRESELKTHPKKSPEDLLLEKAKNLIETIDDNFWSLWENDIENKHDCVLWYKDEYQLDMDENDNWETEEKEGISKAYNELKNLLKENK